MAQSLEAQRAQLEYNEAVIALSIFSQALTEFETAQAAIDAAEMAIDESDVKHLKVGHFQNGINSFKMSLNGLKKLAQHYQDIVDKGDPSLANAEDTPPAEEQPEEEETPAEA